MAPLQQLNLKLPPAVVAHWRAQAEAQGLSVRDWLLAQLGPAVDPPPLPPALAALSARVLVLEQALARLLADGGTPASAAALEASEQPSAWFRLPEAERDSPSQPPVGGISTAELAARTGTSRSGWHQWARGKRPGAVRHHRQAGSWRLLGRVPALGSHSDRCLWEPA